MKRLRARAAQRFKNDHSHNRRTRLAPEFLEERCVLSATGLSDDIIAVPAAHFSTVTNTTPVGLAPAQVQQAYGFNGITFQNGAIQGQGQGQTIAIVDAYNDPNIQADLHTFDQTFGLVDPPSFQIFQQYINGAAPRTDAGWSQEISLDVEWAHAMAPLANIVLVEANTSSLTNLLSAVDYAKSISTVSVVSMSWGSSEFSNETSYDSHFTTPSGHQGITFVASAGDSGAGALWPAASSNVLAVGGTTLSVGLSGSYSGESAWSGSGGAYSSYEGKPTYQSSLQTNNVRSVPDVAYDANPSTGFAVFDSVAVNGRSGWMEVGGTSAGAPQWAALVAIADQGRALAGKGTLANAQAAIATLSTNDFHDVTTGSNGNSARSGYDLVTGRGSPIAGAVVSDLVGLAASPTFTIVSSTTPTYPWAWLLQLLRSRGLSESSPFTSVAGENGLAGISSNSAISAVTNLFVGASESGETTASALGSSQNVELPALASVIPVRSTAAIVVNEATSTSGQIIAPSFVPRTGAANIDAELVSDAIEVNRPAATAARPTRKVESLDEAIQLGDILARRAESALLSDAQIFAAVAAPAQPMPELSVSAEQADAVFSAPDFSRQSAVPLDSKNDGVDDAETPPTWLLREWELEPAVASLTVMTAMVVKRRRRPAERRPK